MDKYQELDSSGIVHSSCRILATMSVRCASAMLDCIRQDYVRTSRAKGKKESVVIFRDTLKNALLRIITLTRGTFASMIGGAVMIEQVLLPRNLYEGAGGH